MKTIQELATFAANQFTEKTRDNGDKFLCQTEPKIDWINDLIREAHADHLPDDYRYLFISEALDAIADCSDETDIDTIREHAESIIDSNTEVYNSELLKWLSSNLNRASYCDEAKEEIGTVEDDLMMQIQRGYYWEAREVFNSVFNSLTEIVENDYELEAINEQSKGA